MKKLFLYFFLSLILFPNQSFSKALNLKCIEIINNSVWEISLDTNTEKWGTTLQSGMFGKYIDNNFFMKFEFPKNEKDVVAKIKYNIPSKTLYVDYYNMSHENILNKVMNSSINYMNENQIVDFKLIKKSDFAYIFYKVLRDEFEASREAIYKCDDVKKINDSNNIDNLPEILKNPDNVQNAQLAEYLLEATHILSKAKIHLKKCLDEYNLYNSLKEKFCSSLYEKMKNLYIPAEKAMSLVRPKMQSAYDKYGSNPEDAPTWYIDLNRELGPIGTAISEYRKYRDEVEALFASN